MQRKGNFEIGVSVYPAVWKSEFKAWELDCNNLATLDELTARKRTAFLVTGKRVGWGMDDEPLLRNVKVVKEVPYKEIGWWNGDFTYAEEDAPRFDAYIFTASKEEADNLMKHSSSLNAGYDRENMTGDEYIYVIPNYRAEYLKELINHLPQYFSVLKNAKFIQNYDG